MSAETVIQAALADVGYLEKNSNRDLYDKTANAGSNNYTKYGAWYDGGTLQGQPWCDMAVSYWGEKGGEGAAVGCYAYVPSHVSFFKRQGRYYSRDSYRPVRGDVVFFQNESHVGLVESVSGGYVHTIEGNTSGGSALIANGGGVCRKTYALTSSYILGYGHPAYSSGAATSTTTETTAKEAFEMAKTYRNGSTSEVVYADTGKKTKIGSLNPWETCDCLGTIDGMYIVRYPVDGTNTYKVGVVVYSGGVSA